VDLRATINPRLTGPVRNELEAARRDVLSGIASEEAGRQILKQLVQPDIFSPVGKQSVIARMYRGPDGLYLGHARGVNGEIIGNARWVKISSVGARLLTSAGMLTGHLMLVEMSNKLDGVQVTVDAIRAGQEDDRVQKLRAAIHGVENALETSIAENRRALMIATIPQLQEAVHQNIATLKREIAEIPLPETYRIPFRGQHAEVRSKLRKAARTFMACLQGVSVLSQAYFALDERGVGRKSALSLLAELDDAGTSSAEYKARLLKPENIEDRPEKLWIEFRRVVPDLIGLFEIEGARRNEETAELNVELLPEEIISALRVG